MDEVERRYLLRVLALAGGNKSRAADMVSLNRRTLYRKLEQYGTLADNRITRVKKGEPEVDTEWPEAV